MPRKNTTIFSDETILKLKEFYPSRGKNWCMLNLDLTEQQVRHLAAKFKLRQDQNSAFFKEWQKRAAFSKVGKKTSQETKDKLSAIQKIIQPKTIFNKECEVCRVLYKVVGTQNTGYLRKTCGSKKCIRNLGANKNQWKKHSHPRGFLGGKHTEAAKRIMSEVSKTMWKDPLSKVNSKAFKQEQSNRMSKRMVETMKGLSAGNIYSRTKKSWKTIGGKKHFYKSSWEVVYAQYLQWLKEKKEIVDWDYETKTFWFEKIKRGVRSYTPDFEITNKGCTQPITEFHEVKGWMDKKSKTKLKRMGIYYPEVKVVLIDQVSYKSIKKWERLFPEAK